MIHNDHCVSWNSDKANNYFHSVFSTSDDTPTTDHEHQPSSPILHETNILNCDVLEITWSNGMAQYLKELKLSILHALLISRVASKTLPALSYKFIPQDWRTYCVIPVYKYGDKTSVSNYRPTSLWCILSKVLERVVYNNIIEHVWHLSTKCQFDFFPEGLHYNNCCCLPRMF